MSTIQSLGISGIRGYQPQNFQKIQFMKPLTLIWGKNGSGKTTIIQCLKYITTGSLPPNSDKGKSFIMDTKVAGKPEVIGDIRLIFKAGSRPILAKRRITLSTKGSTSKFQSIEQVLKTKGQNGEELTINHQCAEIQKQVPQFLGISKPILQNIVFCHQDQSLWPFGDSVLLKSIFDELFDTKKITKQMDRMWQIHKQQQIQLKELKIRVEYQKLTHKNQLDLRSKLYAEMEQIYLRSKEMQTAKAKILKIKRQIGKNDQKTKQREKILLAKGRLENSIINLEMRIKDWKEKLLKLYKDYEQRLKGKQINTIIEDDSFSYSQPVVISNGEKSSDTTSQSKIEFVSIFSAEEALQELKYKRQFYEQMLKKYKTTKQQHQNIKQFKQVTKREQQIKSEIERIKSLLPEMKYSKDAKNNDDFLKLLKQKITDLGQLKKGKDINKAKLETVEIPNFVDMGLNEKEMQQLKKQSRQLQEQIKQLSIVILKIYKAQYKISLESNKISPLNAQKFTLIQSELNNIFAIINSKRQQLRYYQQQNDSQSHLGNENLQKQIYHYRIAGIELQNQMMHFCEEKKKCYFCSRKMNDSEIIAAREKIETVKAKTENKLKELQARKTLIDKGNYVNPEIMVKKLNEQILKLQDRQNSLTQQFTKNKQLKNQQKLREHNLTLKNQLTKANLNPQILNKLGQIVEENVKPQAYYERVSIEQFKQMCNRYSIKIIEYKGVRQQTQKIEENQTKNQLIKKKRQSALKQKQQLKTAIEMAEQQTKNYDFLRQACQKLETLLKFESKSKSKKSNKKNDNNNTNMQIYSSQNSSLLSIEEVERSFKELFLQILRQKLYIERLQVSLGYLNDFNLLQEEKSNLKSVNAELAELTNQLKAQKQLENDYHETYHSYQKQAELHRNRLQTISKSLHQPLQTSYLISLNKIRHLQASILNIQQCYHLLQKSVSNYHSEKMQEINRYIYQVWREIYHGEDIQFIQIEAFVEPGSKKKKKNYQYRILMKKSTKNFKGQEKVDMKGRCSTGQKVLASIVIRLALAEVFCSSTRILALDEPTTNLDKEHIENLALALLRLIQLSGGRNLQLIIISHDIQFIKLLEQYADSYYEVKRDHNRFSTIEKRMIKDIFQRK